jgi:hypothetical protein
MILKHRHMFHVKAVLPLQTLVSYTSCHLLTEMQYQLMNNLISFTEAVSMQVLQS